MTLKTPISTPSEAPPIQRHVVEAGHDGARGTTTSLKIVESLFDLYEDPLEQRNLIAEYAKVAKQLREAGKAHLKQYTH